MVIDQIENGVIGVSLAGAVEFDADFGFDAEFFAEFSFKGFLDVFSVFKFATRKFPA